MAKIDNLLEGGQGSLGNLVFYKMNGKSYVRTKPQKYRDSKSPAQLAQRQRLQVVNNFLRPFREIVRVTFAAEATGRSALQAATSYNMRNALSGGYPDIHVDKSKALLSSGPLPLPAGARMKIQPDGVLIGWENGDEARGKAADDTLVVLAFSEDARRSDYRFTGIRRTEGQYLWKPAFEVSPGNLPDVWIAFQNAATTKVSNSLYIAP